MESNPKGFELLKTYLAVSLWTPCFGKSKSNTIENTAEVRPVAGGAKPPRNGSFSLCSRMKTKKIPKNEFSLNAIPRDEQKCIPACHTFYMSYDKNVKRMASMHICLHTSLHGYFFIKLQLHFHTTMNQYVNKSIRQRIIEASKKRPFSTKGISPSI